MTDLLKDISSDFAKDRAKETEGVFMTYKRFRYKVARAHRNNVAFQKMMEERLRPYQWALQRGDLESIKTVAEEVIQEVYAHAVLKDITHLDGTPVGYTPEIGIQLFKKIPDLWDEIFAFAAKDSNYTPDQILADSKNS